MIPISPAAGKIIFLVVAVLSLILMTSPVGIAGDTPEAPLVPFKITNTLLHDPTAFTEGLTIASGILYKGTGAFAGRASTLTAIDLATCTTLNTITLDPQLFGEGITLVGDQVLVYERKSLELLHTMSFQGQGWGLTFDGTHLIHSDGTAALFRHEVGTFAEVGRIEVTAGGQPVKGLNELEMVEGKLFANIWMSDRIAIIDPANGTVTGCSISPAFRIQRTGSRTTLFSTASPTT